MIFGFIALVIGIFGVIGYWKLINHYNFEMNFNESLLYSINTLMLILICLVDYSLIQIIVKWEFYIFIVIYFLLLLLFYYISRAIKLKKYIPLKTIIGYILISVINLIVLFIILNQSLNNINGWNGLVLFLIYIVLSIAYNVLLIIINLIILLINKNNKKYINKKYKISKFSFISTITMIILSIGLIFIINNFNKSNYKKIMEKQKEIVAEYLKKEYSEYNFKIIESYEFETDCEFMWCVTPTFRNKIKYNNSEKAFFIDVKKEDLSIYKDELKEELQKEK